MNLGQVRGFSCKVGEAYGIIDAGIPHYRGGSIHVERNANVSLGDDVIFWGTSIGKVVKYENNSVTFKSSPITIYLNDEIILDLSLYLWIGKRPLIKVIPRKPALPKICPGEEVIIRLCKSS